MHVWANDRRLSKRDRAIFNQKLDRLLQMDFKLAWDTKLLDGPVSKSKHVYKLVIHGDVMMRPMLCRGPVDNEVEYTLLFGAIEKDRKLHPKDCIDRALENRSCILNDRTWRGKHERIPTEADRGFPRPGIS